MLELILGVLLAAGATYFVLRPILRPPVESEGSEPVCDEGEDPAADPGRKPGDHQSSARSVLSRTWCAIRERCGLLFRMRPALGLRPRLLRALRLDARRRRPLLQSLRSPRRRLTLAFSSPVSYQSASLNSGVRREPMGLAVGNRAAACGIDRLVGGCAAPATGDRHAIGSAV